MTANESRITAELVEAKEERGRRFLREGLYEEAAENFRDAISSAPHAVMAWVGLGVALRFAGDFDGASTAFDRALSLEPGNVDAIFGLANLYRAAGEPTAAAEMYRQVLELDPGHAEAHYFLAVVTSGNTPESIPATLIRDLFDAYAPTYDDHLLGRLEYRLPQLFRESAERFFGARPASSTVMDLGCGTGLCGSVFRDIAKRLIGVDLSARMIDRARGRGVYDELLVEDLCVALRSRKPTIDLAVAADVAMYLGDLSELFSSSKAGLAEGGRLLFNTEIAAGQDPYDLLPGGRFAHRREYVEELAATCGLSAQRCERIVARVEDGQPVFCHLFLLTNPASSVSGRC